MMKNLVHRLEIFLLTIQRTLKRQKTSMTKNYSSTLQRTNNPQNLAPAHEKFLLNIQRTFFARIRGCHKKYFLSYNGHLSAVCPEKNKKPPVSDKAGGAEKRPILSF